MALNFGQSLFGRGLFKISPEDDDVLKFQGSREIPGTAKSIIETGPNSPGTMADDSAVGTLTWATPDNAKVEDGSTAIASGAGGSQSHYLKATNFGFSIPQGAEILGILVEVKKGASRVQSTDTAVRIVKGGSIGTTDKSSLLDWPVTILEFINYGGLADLWGETWTPADINASNFGFVISANNNPGLSSSLQIDHIKLTVKYNG